MDSLQTDDKNNLEVKKNNLEVKILYSEKTTFMLESWGLCKMKVFFTEYAQTQIFY